MSRMEKSDLVKAVANQCNISQRNVHKVISLMFQTIELALKCDEEVIISGFGKFTPRHQKARTKHNPKTLEKVEVPAKRIVTFKPSAPLKRRIAN